MNIIFILMDSVRHYKLGCYGNKEKLSPYIDELSKKGTFFNETITQSNCTDPSLWSIFTSKYPSEHGVLANAWVPKKNFNTMTSFLKNGRDTCATSSSNHHDPNKWIVTNKKKPEIQLLNGFNTQLGVNPKSYYFIEKFAPKLGIVLRYTGIFNGLWRRDKITNQKAINWLENRGQNDFYLFIHYCDAHPPYEKFTYEQEIQNVDNAIETLVENIKSQGKLEETLIILTSDHGAWLNDYKIDTQSLLSDKIIKVPLILINPKLPSKKIDRQIRSIDILPTALDIIGEDKDINFTGKSLLPLIKHKKHEFPKFAISEGTLNRNESKSIRCKEWKYIFKKDARDELFCLKDDPEEENNLINQKKDKAMELKKNLFQIIGKNQIVQKQEYDEITERELVKMGYLKK